MSNSLQTHVAAEDVAVPLNPLPEESEAQNDTCDQPTSKMEKGTASSWEEEVVPLNLIPGSSDAQNNDTCNQVTIRMRQVAASCCDDKYHKKLAICSIICGFSCIGIKALINSVKAERESDPQEAANFSRKARKYGIISIVTWVSILAIIPLLMALFSYLATLQD